MLVIPAPFVVALALALVLGVLSGRDGWPASWPLTAFLIVAILQSVLVGLRWCYDLPTLRLILPVTAALLPTLAWATVDALRGRRRGLLAQALPAVGIVTGIGLLVLLWRRPIDLILAGIEGGYGIAILAVARSDPDRLGLARLGDAPGIRPMILSLGGLLVATALIDGIVAIDIAVFGGTAAAMIVSVASLFMLAAGAGMVVMIGRSQPLASVRQERQRDLPIDARASIPRAVPDCGDPAFENLAVLATIDSLMSDRSLYRDPDLTLDRLARRAGLPARIISAAVNRVHRTNVSQYVNGFRIAEAQRLLQTTDRPITAIVFDVGFQTKSNFNREFRRVTKCSPTEWRLRDEATRVEASAGIDLTRQGMISAVHPSGTTSL